jgi:hypothetical protein
MSKKSKSTEQNNNEKFERFEDAMKKMFSLSKEQVEEIKKKVPYPKKERTEEEYNEKISIYPDEEKE